MYRRWKPCARRSARHLLAPVLVVPVLVLVLGPQRHQTTSPRRKVAHCQHPKVPWQRTSVLWWPTDSPFAPPHRPTCACVVWWMMATTMCSIIFCKGTSRRYGRFWIVAAMSMLEYVGAYVEPCHGERLLNVAPTTEREWRDVAARCC